MSLTNLIIDDDEIALMLTELLMQTDESFGKSNKFLDGVHAIDYLKKEYSKDKVYVIILDINMPIMDGWEFLEEIETFVSSENTFVFMASSSVDQKDIEKSKNSSLVKGFFSKPLQKEHIEEIRKLVMHEK